MPFERLVAIWQTVRAQLALWHCVLKHLNPAAHKASGDRLLFAGELWCILDEPHVSWLKNSDNALPGEGAKHPPYPPLSFECREPHS